MNLIIVILIILVIFFLLIKKQQIEHFGWFSGAFNSVKKGLSAAAKKIKEAAEWLAKQVKAGILKALDFLKSIPKKISEPFKKLFKEFTKIIEKLFYKVFDKIMEIIGLILEKIFGPIFEPLMPYIYAIGIGVVLLIVTCFGAMIFILTRPDDTCNCE
jgi:preprotein translocase subunit YajC